MKEKSLVGYIPGTLLNDNINSFGYAQIPQHISTGLIYAGSQRITNDRYATWSYDMMTNLANNKHYMQMVVNKGLLLARLVII